MSYEIVDNIWETLGLDMENSVIVTDENIYKLYQSNIDKLCKKQNICILPPGEKNKNIETIGRIYSFLIEKNLDRKATLIALGGGVIGDMTGFVASTYKRGIDYIQVPTTLLSQVDSSIGGKTGIDFLGYKNIIGSFYLPKKTLIDISFLKSLPKREIVCGLGEVIKYGIIWDYDFLKYINKNIDNIFNFNYVVLNNIVSRSVEIKDKIVKQDLNDKGLRQILNFGHTVAHAIEAYYDYEKYNHGEAVILGMKYEATIGYLTNLIDKDYYNIIISSLDYFLDDIKDINFEKLIDYMRNDKKNMDENIVFVLPTGFGKVDIFNNITEKNIIDSILYNKDDEN